MQSSGDAEPAEIPHRIRTSLEFVSFRDVKFTGKVFFRVHAAGQVGLSEYRTSPAYEITRAGRDEIALPATFHSFERDMLRGELKAALQSVSIEIDMLSVDRNSSERLAAQFAVLLEPLAQCAIVKTSTSYVRIYDAFHRLADVANPSAKLAETRVKLYMEDLGPVGAEEEGLAPVREDAPANDELEELQMRVVAELDHWKKAQELKFLLELKNKEFDALSKALEEAKRRDVEKEKICRNYEASVAALEAKLRDKLAELQRREHKLILVENELKAKMTEAASEVAAKTEQGRRLRGDFDDERKKWRKARAALETRAEELQQTLLRKDAEIERLRAELDRGPVGNLRAALQARELDGAALKHDLIKAVELQAEYRDFAQKLQTTFTRLKQENEALQLRVARQDALEAKTRLNEMLEPGSNSLYEELRKDLHNVKEGKRLQPPKPPAGVFPSQAESLVCERQRLLEMGVPGDDIVIAEIDEQIAALQQR